MTKTEPFGDPLCVIISDEEVNALDIEPALKTLRLLISTPNIARANMERVDVGFHGYDGAFVELFEIPSVREYVHLLDEQFPFWLFFLSKHMLGLQCLAYCHLLPFLTDDARAETHPQQLGDLLLKRWIPAMNHISEFAGLSEGEVDALTDRSIRYFEDGRFH